MKDMSGAYGGKEKPRPDEKMWQRQVAGREKNDLGNAKEPKHDSMIGATGTERKNNLQNRKFGDHGPE